MSTHIDDFLQRYTKEYDFYNELARICSHQCESALQQNGIRAIVSYRAKRVERLGQKLIKRHGQKNYTSVDSIYSDIADLSGVRIALYFPGDRKEVNEQIGLIFLVHTEKEFPNKSDEASSVYKKRFNGYTATHFRVSLKEESLSETQKRFAKFRVEIQVASVLMHAWAEVEHDLVYKPLSGSLSKQEYMILDELNGLVLAGEIALENLQTAVQHRVSADGNPFNNHYELAAYLHTCIRTKADIKKEDVRMGRADILLRFLQMVSLNTPSLIKDFIKDVTPDTSSSPIVEQVVDAILDNKPEWYIKYMEAQRELGRLNPYSSSDETRTVENETSELDHFIARWIALESGIHTIRKKGTKDYLPARPQALVEYGILQDDHVQTYQWVRQIRNQLIHGVEIPSLDTLRDASTHLDTFIENAQQYAPKDISSAIKKTLDHFKTHIKSNTQHVVKQQKRKGRKGK